MDADVRDMAAGGDDSLAGIEAFWETDSNELWVVQGQSTLVLGFYFTDTSVEVAKPLMQQALSRLK